MHDPKRFQFLVCWQDMEGDGDECDGSAAVSCTRNAWFIQADSEQERKNSRLARTLCGLRNGRSCTDPGTGEIQHSTNLNDRSIGLYGSGKPAQKIRSSD